MSAVRNEFSHDELAAFSMNWRQSQRIVKKFVADTGLRVPVLLDLEKGPDPFCFTLPPGPDETVTEHFRSRVVPEGASAPFPLQIIIDKEGRLAYLSRIHSTNKAMEMLRMLVEE
ncbi:MAG: hypothetical protein CME06_06910 [Gemmatimonadetes bacterium]|nr:hypothetical protein [Gemmatimonadota bacterium]